MSNHSHKTRFPIKSVIIKNKNHISIYLKNNIINDIAATEHRDDIGQSNFFTNFICKYNFS